ncbi:hypothetical protein PIROE2DRAFT_13745 [Piromyces sp. E2]|nr:hypothetical protein PIROE2DRAFT_13745 [Piromyces sp. E2]|eukprot:OUM60473.1 hypothetical protein PIROE2DRAFT_13745 [Piromyces sp. E2]
MTENQSENKMSKYHLDFDRIMKNIFKTNVKLISYYGPVAMGILGMTYDYIPKSYKINMECERGIFIISITDKEGKTFYPTDSTKECYYHDISVEKDIIHLVQLTYNIINNK